MGLEDQQGKAMSACAFGWTTSKEDFPAFIEQGVLQTWKT